MKNSFKTAVVLLILPLTACDLLDDLPIGKGYSAKHLCSFIFTSGLDESLVRDTFIAPKVQPLPWIWDIRIDHSDYSVNVRDVIFGDGKGSATAIYREGKGCTLLIDQNLNDVDGIPFQSITPPELSDSEPWPYGAAGALSNVSDINYSQLQSAIDNAFIEPEDETVLTTAVLVAYDGQMIAERYDLGANEHTRLPGWSMTKSITGTLAGILVSEGKIKLDDPAPIPDWHGTDKHHITLRHLLHMSSGLEVNEDYSGFSDVTQMLYKESNQYAYAINQPVVTPPYTEFKYSTAETNRLAAAIQALTGNTQQDVYAFYEKHFFHAIDITSALIEFDATGHFVGGAYGYMTARDWARIGQLYLQKGKWKHKQILTEDWVRFATTPSPVADDYGAQLWLNTNGNRWKNVPSDAYALVGHQGQRVVIVPSLKLVVVRTGVTEDRNLQNRVMSELLDGIIAALPESLDSD
ncbi:MAG: serine hydrolase [Ketobacter sp.]|nr:serine hydrolase [Ketobacter sp.]